MDTFAAAPRPAHRLIPSQFPPIGVFDTVATTADLVAVMELVGWTNDRLVADRIDRLPQSEWVHGVPNASIVMAAFLHVAPGGDSMAPSSAPGMHPTIFEPRLLKSVIICDAKQSLAAWPP
jgi:hypothetical protein